MNKDRLKRINREWLEKHGFSPLEEVRKRIEGDNYPINENEEMLNRQYNVHLSETASSGKYRPTIIEGDAKEYFAKKGNIDSTELIKMINCHLITKY